MNAAQATTAAAPSYHESLGDLPGDHNQEKQIGEIQDIIKRMDSSRDQGFTTKEQEYVEKRLKVRAEIEQLTPIPEGAWSRRPTCLNTSAATMAQSSSPRRYATG